MNDSTSELVVKLDSIPQECHELIIHYLSDDCKALNALLRTNHYWFQLTIPCLYRSPFRSIEKTWPKLSKYSQEIEKKRKSTKCFNTVNDTTNINTTDIPACPTSA